MAYNNTTKNTNLFYQLYSTDSAIVNSGFKCTSSIDESQTSFDISGNEGEITDSNGNTIASIDLSPIHADGLSEYYTETKIIGPQSAYLLQGNVTGETYASQSFIIPEDIQTKAGYESYINLSFDIHYTSCGEIQAIRIDTYKLRTEPGSVTELIQSKLDELKIPVSVTIRRLPAGNCEAVHEMCPNCSQEIDYLVFQSSEEGYSFYVHSILVQIVDIDYLNYNQEWVDYTESPFRGADLNFDYIIDLIKTKRPRLIGEKENPTYATVPCDLYKYFIRIAPGAYDEPDAFRHNLRHLIEFCKTFNELGQHEDAFQTEFIYLSHMYPDIYTYYWANEYSILNKYNIHDIIEMLSEIAETVAKANVDARPREILEDIDKRIYNQKYANGAFRGIVLVPDWPSGDNDYSVLKLAHVPDYITTAEKIEIPKDMHIEGFRCNTCIDAFIKMRAMVKVNTLLQSEYEIYNQCDCNTPVRKVTSNESLSTCTDGIWTYDLHAPINSNDGWTNSPDYQDATGTMWSDEYVTHAEHHAHNHKDIIDGINEFDKSKYAFLDDIPGYIKDKLRKPDEKVVGLYGYMSYLNENDLWTRVGQAYMVIGAKDDYQSKIKNLQNSVLLYNPNNVPIRVKFMVFS